MTLERIEHKIFASEAPLDEMGQFGSALTTTKLNTKDVAEIQALPAYTKGWGSAIISENNYPAMEEMNGVLNVMSYHTGYLYQEGIPVYSSTQTYSATSMVKSLDGKSIYRSLKENNKGNSLEDRTSWELFDFSKGTLKTNQITNCITEIPQRIKYTLENGTLTIKAGSVVIVPYGTEDLTSQYPVGSRFIHDNFKVYDTQFSDGKFFVWAEIQEDISRQVSGNGTNESFVQVSLTRNSFWIPNIGSSTSGSTDGTISAGCYYNTSTNLFKNYDHLSDVTALPCMIIQGDGTYYTGKVNQVFNGMGHIGYNIFVDKGVKVLISDGKNADGTLKNIEYITDKLFVTDYSAGAKTQFYYALSNKNGILNNKQVLSILKTRFYMGEIAPTGVNASSVFYNTKENQFYVTTDGTNWQKESLCLISNYFSIGASNITEFKVGEVIRILKSSDKHEISGYGMPSGKYIDLTLGASGTTYTAPANGFITLCKTANGNQYVTLRNTTNGLFVFSSGISSNWVACTIPCKKSDNIYVEYNTSGTTNMFRFIYAEGEV